MDAGKAVDDEVWQLPLPAAYADYLKSDIADLNNANDNGFAGAIVAGLFLEKFVGAKEDGTPIDWAHFDTFAWRPAGKPGRPKGGDALGLRQSGFPDYVFADPFAHKDLIAAAGDDARLIIARDPAFTSSRGKALAVLQELFDWKAGLALKQAG